MRDQREIYHDILAHGLLIIRNVALSDPGQAHAEADHLHNLPELLSHLDRPELAEYYWNVIRVCYIKASKPEWSATYDNLWRELEEVSNGDGI